MIGVAFDLDGTLLRNAGLERAAFLELLRKFCAERASPFDESHAAEAGRQAFSVDDERGPAQAALVKATRSFLGEEVPERIVLSRFRQLAMQLAPDFVEPAPGARETLAQLTSLGIPQAILTNGWSSIQQRKARYLGFDGPVLVSEDSGRRKPEKAAFEALGEVLNLPLDCIWYVGNDPLADIDGAVGAGLHAIWLCSGGETLPPGGAQPEHTLDRIDDLLGLLSERYTRTLLGLRYILHNSLAWRSGHFIPGVEYGLNDPASLIHLLPRAGDDA